MDKAFGRSEVLTEDQMGRNPDELKKFVCLDCPLEAARSQICRIPSEHPADEAATVVQSGCILGGLEPSWAFGDSRYEWPREVQEV